MMVKVYDLEVMRNFFLYIDLELKSDDFTIFEISSFKNELKELLNYLKNVKGQIGFNNINYDSQIIQYIIENQKKLLKLNSNDLTEHLHDLSNEIINEPFPRYWESDLTIPQCDPFKILHYDNRARSASLKWIQYSMDWYNIEDMPLKHWELIDSREKADIIISYCKNDCLSTRQLYNIIRGKTDHILYKGKDKVQLRYDVQKEFGFRCLNYSDVKIGDQLNKSKYSKALGIKESSLKYLTKNPKLDFTFEECFPDYISFQTEEFNQFVDSFKTKKVNLNKKQEFRFKYNKTEYTIAKGGIHSNEGARLIVPTKDQILRDADIGSQYPNAIAKRDLYPSHLDKIWIENYKETIQQRIDAKHTYKKTKENKWESIAETFKLSLNGGGFGKLNEATNWQYDPFACFQTTIGNQMEILMLIESLEIIGVDVISANTDGIICLFDKSLESDYYQVCKEWEKRVGNDKLGLLEYKDYSLIAQRSINHYIAIPADGSEPKTKGSFLVDYELHKNKSNRVIPLALQEYYHRGTSPSKFIREHNNIFDFCAGSRAKGDWTFMSHQIINGEYIKKVQQKTLRYYISNDGCKLLKYNETDGREIQEDSGKWLCTIFNKYEEKNMKEYDINYDYYINQAYKIISEIQPEVINRKYTQLSIF